MAFVQEGDEILSVETAVTPNQQAVARAFHCFAKKLVVSGAAAVPLNTPLPVAVSYRDWQDNPLPDENSLVIVKAEGPGMLQEIELAPAAGQAEFAFQSAVAGSFKLIARAGFPCAKGVLEVIVSG